MDEQLALGRRQVSGQDLHQCRLAGAVVAQDAQDLALSQLQRYPGQCRERAEALDDALGAQGVGRWGGAAFSQGGAHRGAPRRRRRPTWMLNSIAAKMAAPRMMLNMKALTPIRVN